MADWHSIGYVVFVCSVPNAHHHPPEEAVAKADLLAPGRVNDDVRPHN